MTAAAPRASASRHEARAVDLLAPARDEEIARLHGARVVAHAAHAHGGVADDVGAHRQLARELVEREPGRATPVAPLGDHDAGSNTTRTALPSGAAVPGAGPAAQRAPSPRSAARTRPCSARPRRRAPAARSRPGRGLRPAAAGPAAALDAGAGAGAGRGGFIMARVASAGSPSRLTDAILAALAAA